MVTVDFSGGALTLTGDAGDHSFTIEALDATTFQLSGGLDTQFKLGSDPATDTLRLTGSIKSLTATLGAGIDNFDIVGLNVAGDVTIDAGAGTNNLEIIALTAKGSLEITGGGGNDDVILGSGAVVVKKNATIDLGDGDNLFRTAAILMQIGGELSYTGGNNDDTVQFAQGKVVIGRDAILTFGAGSASMEASASNIKVGKNLVFDSTGSLAGENSSLTLTSGLIDVRGDLIYRDGAANSQISTGFIGSQVVRGNLHVTTGGGTYNLTLLGAIAAKTQDINASASAGGTFTSNTFGGKTTQTTNFTGSDAPDNVTISQFSIKPVSITANMGGGNNNFNLQAFSSVLKGLTVIGGSGNDQVSATMFGSTITGGIDIQNGDGPATTTLQLLGTKMKGLLSVSNGADAGASSLVISSFGTQLGGIDFTTGAAMNTFAITGPNDLSIKGAVRFTGGAGNDTVDLSGLGGGKVGKGDHARPGRRHKRSYRRRGRPHHQGINDQRRRG